MRAWTLTAFVASASLGVAMGTSGASTTPHVNRTISLGTSVQGRAIMAFELGDPQGPKVVVVGCIHGDEPAGIAVVDRLRHMRPPSGIDLWLVPVINPDGVHAGTRGNAHGVDLNRNFPWHWRPLTGLFYSGQHALSEPESRLAARLILRLRPRITIWFHQPFDVVDESGGSLVKERTFARVARLPLRLLSRFPGSAASWENALLPESSAFVAELPPGRPTDAAIARYDRATVDVATTAASDGGR